VTPSKKIVLNFSKLPVVVRDEREYSEDDEEGPEEEDSEQIIYSNSYDGESSEKDEHSESGSVLNQYYQQQ